MSKLMLACCKIYISESRNKIALESIEQASKFFPNVAIINKFEDDTYNRVGYTLVSELGQTRSSDSRHLTSAVLAMVKSALELIDLQLHCGSHPRIGVVDHICFHPLQNASLDRTAGVARSLATAVGSSLQVPTFLYGAAHDKGRTLDSIRRELGYFKPNYCENQWVGMPNSESLSLKPDSGPTRVSRANGVVVIGASRWADNYNVPIFTSNISAVRKIARRVSSRGGGLPSVQAMALAHGEGVIEVACNLLEPSITDGGRVQLEVEQLAGEEGLSIGKGYFTDFSQEEIISRYLNAVPSS